MTHHNPLAWIDDELDRLDRDALRRRLITREGVPSVRMRVQGREFINFASNDYLALAGDPRLVAAARQATAEEGWGAGASPLIVGHADAHRRLEQRLAEFEGAEAALLFPSGYAANSGTIAALATRGDVVFSDELNHASIVDGCRLSRADVRIFPHCDYQGLQEQLQQASGFRRRLIVTDSLFSMHGDVAPLEELARLAERYDAMLMIDEAHATGVFGRRGRGVAEEQGVEGRVPIRVGTFSKALGSSGGFVAGSQPLIDWLINRARPYVFSTATPPANSAAAVAALDLVDAEPQRRETLLNSATQLRQTLAEQGWDTGPSTSQIIPVFVGQPERALELSAALRADGLWVPAIRPPTVPPGESCLRISLSTGHTTEVIDPLIATLCRLRPAGAS